MHLGTRTELLVFAAGIVGLGVATSIVVSNPSRAIGTDAVEYLGIAKHLAATGHFSSYYLPGEPELYRTPGYPLLLCLTAAWKSVVGLRLLIVVQSLLALLSALFIVSAAHSQGFRRPWFLGGLFLLSPVVLAYTVQIGTEPLFVLLTCLAARLLLVRGGSSAALLWGCSGLAVGASVLVRPIGLVLVVLGLICCAARLREPASRHRALAWSIAALILPCSWAIHNGVQHGYWGYSKTGMSYASSVFGDAHQGFGDQGSQTGVTDDWGVRDAVADVIVGVTEHPGAAMKTLAGGAAKTLLGPGEWAMRRLFLDDRSARDASRPASWYEIGRSPSGLEFRARTAAITAAVANPRTIRVKALLAWSWLSVIAIYGIALAGAGHALRFHRGVGAVWMAAAVLLLMASSGYQASARFRLPILPFALLCGACYRPEEATTSEAACQTIDANSCR